MKVELSSVLNFLEGFISLLLIALGIITLLASNFNPADIILNLYLM